MVLEFDLRIQTRCLENTLEFYYIFHSCLSPPFSSHLYFSNSLPCFLCVCFSCHSLCASSRVRTGLWVWTVSTCVMATAGKKTCHWTFFHMMQGQTADSPFRLPTLRPSHRIKSHRWAAQVHTSKQDIQKNYTP